MPSGDTRSMNTQKRSRTELTTLVACALGTSVFAQNSTNSAPDLSPAGPAPIVQAAAKSAEFGAVVPTTFRGASVIDTPIPAFGTEPVVPSSVPPVVSALLPVRDTNVAIGISYPSGSADFVYLVAGMPRRSDPRLPPEAFRALPPPVAPVPVFSGPSADMYERVERGAANGTMNRLTYDDLIFSFPPGSIVRGSSSGGRIPADTRPISVFPLGSTATKPPSKAK
jgi:hypothetical protein